MNGSLTADFAAVLSGISDDIKRQVGALIPEAADRMVGILAHRYPVGRTSHPNVPHMREDIYVRGGQQREVLLPVRKVVGPRLAYIWQDGTTDRVDATRKNARRGRMPAAAPGFFERTAVQVRLDMLRRAQDIVNQPREITSAFGGAGGSLL
jgi:hypothetical protein